MARLQQVRQYEYSVQILVLDSLICAPFFQNKKEAVDKASLEDLAQIFVTDVRFGFFNHSGYTKIQEWLAVN